MPLSGRSKAHASAAERERRLVRNSQDCQASGGTEVSSMSRDRTPMSSPMSSPSRMRTFDTSSRRAAYGAPPRVGRPLARLRLSGRSGPAPPTRSLVGPHASQVAHRSKPGLLSWPDLESSPQPPTGGFPATGRSPQAVDRTYGGQQMDHQQRK